MQLNSKRNFNFVEVTQDVEIWDTKNEIIIDVTETTNNPEYCCGSYEQNYRVKLNEDLSVELRDELINKFPLDGYVNKKSMQELIQDYLDRYDAQSNGVSHFNISEHIGAIRVLNDLLYDIENMM